MSIALSALLVLGLVFLMRDAEATDWLRRIIKARADDGRNNIQADKERLIRMAGVLAIGVAAVPSLLGPGSRHRVARFLDALLSCAPCCAAWAAPPAAGLTYAVGQMNETAAALMFAFVLWPIASVGLLYAFTILSPTQMVAMLLGASSRSRKKGEAKDGPEA